MDGWLARVIREHYESIGRDSNVFVAPFMVVYNKAGHEKYCISTYHHRKQEAKFISDI